MPAGLWPRVHFPAPRSLSSASHRHLPETIQRVVDETVRAPHTTLPQRHRCGTDLSAALKPPPEQSALSRTNGPSKKGPFAVRNPPFGRPKSRFNRPRWASLHPHFRPFRLRGHAIERQPFKRHTFRADKSMIIRCPRGGGAEPVCKAAMDLPTRGASVPPWGRPGGSKRDGLPFNRRCSARVGSKNDGAVEIALAVGSGHPSLGWLHSSRKTGRVQVLSSFRAAIVSGFATFLVTRNCDCGNGGSIPTIVGFAP